MRGVTNRFPDDSIPCGTTRVGLITADKHDIRPGVPKSEDITKRLGFEETKTKSEVQESTVKGTEAGTKSRSRAEGEKPSVDLKKLEGTRGEHGQEMQSDGTSVGVRRVHVYLQELDKLQRSPRG